MEESQRPPRTARGKFRYPWREGNHFELLVDGSAFLPAMLDAIDGARHYVLLEMYLIESGHLANRFIERFVAAARRGVLVCLLLDDFGSMGLSNQDRRKLHQAGVRIAYFNPLKYGGPLRRNLYRDHRKLLCVDGETAFVGGSGITDQFDPEHTPAAWHETMVRFAGPVVADWQDLFAHNWNRWSRADLTLPENRQPWPGDMPGRLVISSAFGRMEIIRSFLTHIARAQQRVWIATAYFIPSRKQRRFLRRAARRGVDVRLLVPGPETDHPSVRHAGRRFYARLLRHGIRIFEYQPRFLHAKVVLIDDWVSTGSSNMDRWSFHWNLEANVEVQDPRFAQEVARMFVEDFPLSHEYSYQEWRARSYWWRLLERFWGRIDQLLEHFGPRNKR